LFEDHFAVDEIDKTIYIKIMCFEIKHEKQAKTWITLS
tara:strand:- start:2271 stop:2384 length:114 start_codon:yes stop_codon:yes gene_type:complete